MSFAAMAIIVVLLAILLTQHYYHAQQLEEAEKSAERWRDLYYRVDQQARQMFKRALAYKRENAILRKCGTGCAVQSERCAFSHECAST